MAGAPRYCDAPAAGSAEAPLAARVFAALAIEGLQSGEQLAHKLDVSAGAVRDALCELREQGAAVTVAPGGGYRLTCATQALEAREIAAYLSRDARRSVLGIDVLWSVESTNTLLLQRPNPGAGVSAVLLAEYQSAGRGRQGRSWLAAPGSSLCLSFSWTFRGVPRDVAALGLMIGVCIVRALRGLDVEGAALKWPNDILVGGRKLGGVLIELKHEANGNAWVVVGIGLNVALGAQLLQAIDAQGLPATDLFSCTKGRPSRNQIAAAVLEECITGLRCFERDALLPFLEEWRALDVLHGQSVTVSAPQGTVFGTARGIDLHGTLLVETPGGLQRFLCGDVTVRA